MKILFINQVDTISFAKTLIEYDVSFTYSIYEFKIRSKETLVKQILPLYNCVVTDEYITYVCPKCKKAWNEEFKVQYGYCNSECSTCGIKDIEPV